MTRHLLFGLIKFSMVFTPFLCLAIMILALWGVVGKASYTDLEAIQPNVVLDAREAKNYLVNETKTMERCPEALKSSDIEPEGEKPLPEKIDWERVV